MSRYGWRPYVPVAVRRARAQKKLEKLRKKGLAVQPVEIEGRKIARTFWGEAWCGHLESFSDYENRLPRGRTYVRNGSVCHLEVAKGEVSAMVSGSELYKVSIVIRKLARKKWNSIKERCSGQVGSLLELLQGRLSQSVMAVVTDRKNGLFPLPGEITLKCSCPDWAVMCKHVAAVLYGVGARLDEKPELLFLLRGVDHEELISAEAGVVAAVTADAQSGRRRIAADALADVFGIEMTEPAPATNELPSRHRKGTAKPRKPSKSAAQPTTQRKPKAGSKAAARTSKPRKKIGSSAAKRTKTRASKAGEKKARARKASVSGEALPQHTTPAVADTSIVTGKDVARLRAKFGMSRSQFAKLLGVSVPSISNWEKRPGALNLQHRTFLAWSSVKELAKQQARRKLEDL